MQSRPLPEDGRARMHRWHIRRRRGGGGPGRPSAGLTIPAMAVVAIAMLVLSCGDTPVEPAPPPSPVATTVAVSPGSAVLNALEDTARFTAEVRDQNGQVMAGAAVAWASSDASVAAVDASGLVTSAGNGSATITATAGSVSGTAAVTVAQVVTAVAVSPAADTLVAFGDTVRLVAEAIDANGHGVAGSEFFWSSSDPLVARVDDAGLVTGVDEGTATITATAGDYSGTAEITTVENTDRAALVALYEATDGRNWIDNTNWLSDEPLGEWYGIQVRRRATGLRVTGLRLSDNALVGEIPSELAGLSALQRLELDSNELTGPIPLELGSLAELHELNLGNNKLTGSIPSDLGNLAALRRLWLQDNGLTGSIPPELGNLADLTWLWLGANELTGSIPSELGNLSRLVTLSLTSNELTGSLPPELGNLTTLKSLGFTGNPLTGVVPKSFLRLINLDSFSCQRTDGLCVPATDEFREWAREVQTRGAFDLALNIPFCDEPDRSALESLFEAASGSGWTQSNGWLEDEDLGMWHGVRTDSIGRVFSLDLSGNGLSGSVPNALGLLTHMKELRIGNSELVGRLPASLTNVPLEEFDYRGTELCVPDEAGFRGWLNGIPRHSGTNVQCSPLTDRDVLTSLYWNSDGPNWRNSRGWVTEAPLSAWYGVKTDAAGRVVELRLPYNGLSGPLPIELGQLSELRILSLRRNRITGAIPRELGNLLHLEWLGLELNQLSGSIPPELGQLLELTDLYLSSNELSGSVPPELGDLSRLQRLWLGENQLSGEIPPELGRLTELTTLNVAGNEHSGPIPPELGDLSRLQRLYLARNQFDGSIPSEFGNLGTVQSIDLSDNRLTGRIPPGLGALGRLSMLNLSRNQINGSIPAELGGLSVLQEIAFSGNNLSGSIPVELGDLANLATLNLSDNQLSGPVPAEFGDLTQLESLILADNPDLAGPLPIDITALGQLEQLITGGTGLCRPPDAGFDAWFRTIAERWLVPCEHGAAVYLTQTVQSWDDPVSLLAGESALLRVFVTAPEDSGATMPDVRATFYVDGAERHTVQIPASMQTIPSDVAEDDLALSANADIPAEVIAPGLEMVIEVDPDGSLDPALGVTKRIPDSGRMPVDVRALAPFRLTLIPFLTEGDPDSSAVDTVASMAADPDGGHELLRDVRTILPVGELVVMSHDPVTTSYRNVSRRLGQVETMRLMEGGTGYWMGMFAQPSSFTTFPSTSSLGGPESMVDVAAGARVVAHELGHNLGLLHAPCGTNVSSLDPWFPHRGGRIGAWGYDPERSALLDPKAYDLMSYCWGNHWISDYFYNKAFDHRVSEVAAESAAAGPVRSLLLWGGRDEDGVAYLDPAFVVDAVPSLPAVGGDYTIEGATADGTPLFSYTFDMPDIEDAEGEETSFAYALPVQADWTDLASITLSGPGGSVTLDDSTDRPMAIVRDPQTRQVRGFLSDLPLGTQTAPAALRQGGGRGMEVLFSRGIPSANAWRR